MILVDYQCLRCGGRSERLVPSPPPGQLPCPACRAPATRKFAPVGLLRRSAPAPVAAVPERRPACAANPDVPALCHMEPSAARAWVARARADNRALDRELERQERAAREQQGQVPDPVHHDHSHLASG
ncbi:MAG TPA: zinc ribbon domain-containing protein [Streptosporangiaceae bacterium]|nr:zinc ribbon domain-containing protein [Streptosporangiaceae bacterium]